MFAGFVSGLLLALLTGAWWRRRQRASLERVRVPVRRRVRRLDDQRQR